MSTEPQYGLARASVTVGEIVYNLRAALDYAIFGVAWLCNGMSVVSGTQFPIDDDDETFRLRQSGGRHSKGHRVSPYLRMIPDPVVESVREYQPFVGCWWTGSLRDLSNPDKHRFPTGLAVVTDTEIRDVGPSGQIDPETGIESMRGMAHLTTVVVFGDLPQRYPIVNYLQFAQREVHSFITDLATNFTAPEAD